MSRLVTTTVLAATLLTGSALRRAIVAIQHDACGEPVATGKTLPTKKADIFASKYKGAADTVAGQIAGLDKGHVSVKILRDTLTFDVQIDMANPKSTYDSGEGQQPRPHQFTVDSHGGCILPYGAKMASFSSSHDTHNDQRKLQEAYDAGHCQCRDCAKERRIPNHFPHDRCGGVRGTCGRVVYAYRKARISDDTVGPKLTPRFLSE